MAANAHTPSQQIRPPYLLSKERINGQREDGEATVLQKMPVSLYCYFSGFCLLPEKLTLLGSQRANNPHLITAACKETLLAPLDCQTVGGILRHRREWGGGNI